jgi:predicted ATPase/class 3 adenylate cyclase
VADLGTGSALPSDTVTFLLTDIEGSTRLWQAHAQAMGTAIARHDALILAAVENHGGRLLKKKGEGDSTFAVFPRATNAVAAALAAQRALVVEPWPDDVRLRVRIALHTGEAELRDGDYFGNTVNRAARLRGIAHGGQVLLSSATADLVRDGLPDNARLIELGLHRLPDLGRAEAVFGLAHPDLPAEFPALRSLDELPGNLPMQLTSFVGREHELELVASALRTSRLVTLTGTGGVGKTRLAVHVAAAALADFTDGAWLCELAAAADPESMLQVVAMSLGLNPTQGASLAASIAEYVGPRQLLIVFDNCEHLLDPVEALAEMLLERCQHMRIIATSREALDVPGERVIRLRSLAVPEVGASLEDLLHVEATRLFIERAEAIGVGRTFGSEDSAAIVEICRRLDGIPLAIELAAARVVALSPVEIAGLLDERFRLLTGGRRAAVERHHTLRATVDWSYSLLSDTERLVFERLGVFPATFDPAAAQAVAGDGLESWDVIDALTSLVTKSMLVADRAPVGPTRYQMLETLRQYARECLDASGAADTCRRRHAEHFAAVSREISATFRAGGDITRGYMALDDVDNFRSAVFWALDSLSDDDGELAIQIIAHLFGLLGAEVWTGIGPWAERSVDRAQRSSPGLRTGALAAASVNAFYRGEFRLSHELALDALRDGVAPDCPHRCGAHTALLMTTRPENIPAVIAEGIASLDALDAGPMDYAGMHSTAAGFAAQAGDLELARVHADRALRLGRESRQPWIIGRGLYLAALTIWQADPGNAIAALEEGSQAMRGEPNDPSLSRAVALAAQVRAVLNDSREAAELLHEAVMLGHRGGDRPALATALDRGIQVLASIGDRESSAVLAGIVTQGLFARMRPLPVHEVPDRQRALDDVEAVLGTNQFELAVARGAAMSYDEAVTFAADALQRYLQSASPGAH